MSPPDPLASATCLADEAAARFLFCWLRLDRCCRFLACDVGCRLCCDKMEERLLEHLTCGHDQGMRSVSSQFDVSVKDTTVGSAHANVAANPSREEQGIFRRAGAIQAPMGRET